MGLAGLALAVSLVSGWFALEAIWGAKQHDALGMFFRVAVAGGLGLLISSLRSTSVMTRAPGVEERIQLSV